MECTLYIDKPAYALKIIIIKFHIKKTKIGVFHTFIIGLTNIRIFTEAEETARSAAPISAEDGIAHCSGTKNDSQLT